MGTRFTFATTVVTTLLVGAAAEAGGANNLNPQNSLCLDLRSVNASGSLGACQSDDTECPDHPIGGPLQCSDDDLDPLNGGICVTRACYVLDQTVVVDIELGPTSQPACGAQVFLGWDTESLDFVTLDTDPDSELGWPLVFINHVEHDAGRIDLVLGLPVGVSCDAVSASENGGTIARLIFTATGECDTPGVLFVPNNPPTRVSGPNGALPIVGCNGDALPSDTGEMIVNATPPVWQCPPNSSGSAACLTNTREVFFPPVSVATSCGDIAGPVTELCTVEYFPACVDDQDCPGDATCVDAVCDAPHIPDILDPLDYLDGGGAFLPGRTEIRCAASSGCGEVSTCSTDIVNTGLNRIVIDIELSPTMVPGDPANPTTRCIEFSLSDCSPVVPSYLFSQDVVFGLIANIPGHGTAIAEIPPANWTCVTARDTRHSLASTCDVACVDGDFTATFKGPPPQEPVCEWLTQGNLDGNDVIDIIDFTLLGGQYLSMPGAAAPCDYPSIHADINGDGVVTLADFTYVVVNFLDKSHPPCQGICRSSP